MSKQAEPRWLGWSLGGAAAALIFVGLWAALAAASAILTHRAQQSWSKADCRLLHFEASGEGRQSARKPWALQLRYRYRVAGVDYESSQAGFSVDRMTPERFVQLRALQRAFDRGQPIPCFYDPEAPAEAVLSRALPGEVVWGGAVIALLCLGLGALLGRGARRILSPRKDTGN